MKSKQSKENKMKMYEVTAQMTGPEVDYMDTKYSNEARNKSIRRMGKM